MDPIIRYKKHTDVQETWREHGWVSPSQNPAMVAKWKFYQTLGTLGDANAKVQTEDQTNGRV